MQFWDVQSPNSGGKSLAEMQWTIWPGVRLQNKKKISPTHQSAILYACVQEVGWTRDRGTMITEQCTHTYGATSLFEQLNICCINKQNQLI